MVGLGSRIPCIFLKAGMTKRLQVTTADTGFPRTDGQTQGGRESRGKKISVTSLSGRLAKFLFLSTSHTTWEGKNEFSSTIYVQSGKSCWETKGEKKEKRDLGDQEENDPTIN